jgi:hypothetical protein
MLIERAIGAATLDGSAYEAIEHDRRATWQAVLVVLVSSLAAGVGAGGNRPRTLIAVTAIALVTWLAWALLIQQIGGRLMRIPGTAVDLGQLVRTIGFAAAPGVLQALAVVAPEFAALVFAVSWIWMFVAMVLAVQHALDYPGIARAAAVCGVALLLILVTAAVIALLIGPTAASALQQ